MGGKDRAACHAAHLYRKTIRECSEMGNLEVWYSHLDVHNLIEKKGDKVDPVQLKHIQAMLDKAMVCYAGSYADQNEADYQEFILSQQEDPFL